MDQFACLACCLKMRCNTEEYFRRTQIHRQSEFLFPYDFFESSTKNGVRYIIAYYHNSCRRKHFAEMRLRRSCPSR